MNLPSEVDQFLHRLRRDNEYAMKEVSQDDTPEAQSDRRGGARGAAEYNA